MYQLLRNRSNQRTSIKGGRKNGRTISILTAVLVFSILLVSQFSAASAYAVSAAPKTPSTAAQAVPLTQSVLLRRNTYQGFEVDSFSANTTLSYAVSSSAPISTALMTSAQYQTWQNDPTDPISNSVSYQNGTEVQNVATIQSGQYFLVFYAYQSRTLVQFGFLVNPTTPFSFGPVAAPLASGISSFGISNSSGTVASYEVDTSQIVGLAKISSLQVNTPDAFRYGVSTSGATLQLNAMLVVADGGTTPQKVYWVQNVPTFVTSTSQVSFGDEIWNNTDNAGFLSNQTITSTNFQNGGFVYPSGIGRHSSGPNLYAFSMNNETYALPFDFGLLMKASVVPGTGVMLQLGYRLLSDGSAVTSPTDWYDNVTIHDANAQAAYFEVAGNSTTPTGHYFDAELVFAGEGNLESAYFSQLNATLGLFYQKGTNSVLSSFPTYYGFSGDTGEAATNLVVTFKNGVVQVAPGANPNYPYLGGASIGLDPNTLTITSQAANQTTASSTTTTSVSTSNSSSSAPSLTQATTPTQPLDLPARSSTSQPLAAVWSYLPAFVICALAAVVLSLAAALTHRRPSAPYPA